MTGATFTIHRDRDVSGVSGTGTVAEGWESSDGEWVIVLWLSATPSLEIHSDIRHVEAIHGHGGATRIVWDTPKQYTPAAANDRNPATSPYDDRD
jgi:hypothetical protein